MTLAAAIPEIWLVPTEIKMVYVTLTTPLSGMLCHPWASTCNSHSQPMCQILRLYVHSLRRYERQ